MQNEHRAFKARVSIFAGDIDEHRIKFKCSPVTTRNQIHFVVEVVIDRALGGTDTSADIIDLGPNAASPVEHSRSRFAQCGHLFLVALVLVAGIDRSPHLHTGAHSHTELTSCST